MFSLFIPHVHTFWTCFITLLSVKLIVTPTSYSRKVYFYQVARIKNLPCADLGYKNIQTSQVNQFPISCQWEVRWGHVLLICFLALRFVIKQLLLVTCTRTHTQTHTNTASPGTQARNRLSIHRQLNFPGIWTVLDQDGSTRFYLFFESFWNSYHFRINFFSSLITDQLAFDLLTIAFLGKWSFI